MKAIPQTEKRTKTRRAHLREKIINFVEPCSLRRSELPLTGITVHPKRRVSSKRTCLFFRNHLMLLGAHTPELELADALQKRMRGKIVFFRSLDTIESHHDALFHGQRIWNYMIFKTKGYRFKISFMSPVFSLTSNGYMRFKDIHIECYGFEFPVPPSLPCKLETEIYTLVKTHRAFRKLVSSKR